MKYVDAKNHSAFVVLNKKREHVATIQIQYPRDGACRVLVNVKNITREAQQRTADRYAATYGKRAKGEGCDVGGLHLWLQASTAGGYGYDKAAAALAGLIVDGHTLAGHCGNVPEADKAKDRLLARYLAAPEVSREDQKAWDAKAAKLGARFANWRQETGRYMSLHFESGTRRLEMFDYTIIQAI